MREGQAVVPADRGEESGVASSLLALAEHPRDVVYVPGRNEFLVPGALADKYRESLTARPRRSKKENSDG